MSEASRSNAPWVIGVVAVIVLLGCCISGAGGVFLFRIRQEEQRRDEEHARAVALQETLPTSPPDVPPPSDETGPRRTPVPPPTCDYLIPDESFEDYQRRCPGGRVPRVAIEAVVETAFGASIPVRVGQTCAFSVENPLRADATGGRWCRSEVRCGDTIVYGGGTSGFFPCTFSTQPPAVVGADTQTTSGDQDGALDLDTSAGRLLVRDDSGGRLGTFVIAARITSVR